MLKKTDKRAQEEMVGFAMIIILVAVILLVLLGISLNKPAASQGVESYEVESFIQAMLQHTTDCSTDFGLSYNDIGKMMAECDDKQICEDERDSCEVLNSTLKDIVEKSWQVGENRPVKGYELNVTSDNSILLYMNEGNITSNYKGGIQSLARRGSSYSVEFRAYY